MNTITIDCGASFLKGALFSNGELVKIISYGSPKVHKDEPLIEPVQIESLMMDVENMVTELADGIDTFKLCMSNEMHGFLLSDKEYEPIVDYISWQKELGNVEINGISSKDYFFSNTTLEDRMKTGMPIRAGLPSCNLVYLFRSGILDESTEEVYLWTLGDYILNRLFGCNVGCHPSNAAATGLFDLTCNNWNKNLYNLDDSCEVIMSRISEEPVSTQWRGKKVIVYPAIGDQQAALLGSGFGRSADLSYNLGTGSQVSVITDSLDFSDQYQIRPYFNGVYIKTVPHIPCGRALNVYIRFFKDILRSFDVEMTDDKIWGAINKEVLSGNKELLKFDMSFFENPLTSNTKGSIENIGEYDLTIANMMAGIFDSMASNYIKALGFICDSLSKIDRVVFSGGVARKNKFLRNSILEKMQFNGDVIVSENETLIGLQKYGDAK